MVRNDCYIGNTSVVVLKAHVEGVPLLLDDVRKGQTELAFIMITSKDFFILHYYHTVEERTVALQPFPNLEKLCSHSVLQVAFVESELERYLVECVSGRG